MHMHNDHVMHTRTGMRCINTHKHVARVVTKSGEFFGFEQKLGGVFRPHSVASQVEDFVDPTTTTTTTTTTTVQEALTNETSWNATTVVPETHQKRNDCHSRNDCPPEPPGPEPSGLKVEAFDMFMLILVLSPFGLLGIVSGCRVSYLYYKKQSGTPSKSFLKKYRRRVEPEGMGKQAWGVVESPAKGGGADTKQQLHIEVDMIVKMSPTTSPRVEVPALDLSGIAEAAEEQPTTPRGGKKKKPPSGGPLAREQGVFSHVRPKIGLSLSCHTTLLLEQYTQEPSQKINISVGLVEDVRQCVYDDLDDIGTVQREDNFGHESVCIDSHPKVRRRT